MVWVGQEEVHEDEEAETEDEEKSEDENTGSLSSFTSTLRFRPPSPEYDSEGYDQPRRIGDTRLCAQYARLLAAYDPRFDLPVNEFWEDRKGPLKIQHLVTHGWIDWLLREKWVGGRAPFIGDEKDSEGI